MTLFINVLDYKSLLTYVSYFMEYYYITTKVPTAIYSQLALAAVELSFCSFICDGVYY